MIRSTAKYHEWFCFHNFPVPCIFILIYFKNQVILQLFTPFFENHIIQNDHRKFTSSRNGMFFGDVGYHSSGVSMYLCRHIGPLWVTGVSPRTSEKQCKACSHAPQRSQALMTSIYVGYPKMVGFPNKPMGFPTKNDYITMGVFRRYRHLRKHPYLQYSCNNRLYITPRSGYLQKLL